MLWQCLKYIIDVVRSWGEYLDNGCVCAKLDKSICMELTKGPYEIGFLYAALQLSSSTPISDAKQASQGRIWSIKTSLGFKTHFMSCKIQISEPLRSIKNQQLRCIIDRQVIIRLDLFGFGSLKVKEVQQESFNIVKALRKISTSLTCSIRFNLGNRTTVLTSNCWLQIVSLKALD